MSQNGKFNITRRDALKGGSALGALALAETRFLSRCN